MDKRRLYCLYTTIASYLICLAAAVIVPGKVSAESDGGQDILTFGVYAHIRSTEVLNKFAPLVAYLESSLEERGISRHVHLRIYSSYPRALEALAAGEVDFVRYGPVSYVLAREENPNIRLLVMESNAGSKTFSGVIAVASESEIDSIADLPGRSIAFGDRRSTTGRYLSQALLVEAGILESDFDAVVYLGRHDKVAFAVASGNYDAGAMNENTFNKYKDDKGLRAIARFSCVTKPWATRQGLDEAVYDALRQILLELDDPELLARLKRDGLLPADDSDYDSIRESMRLARQFDEQQLVFGAYASRRPSDVFSTAKPILNALGHRLGTAGQHVGFDVRVFPAYMDAVDGIASGQIDVARLGPASYVMAIAQQPRLQVLAQEVNSTGKVEGVFVVRRDSLIRSLQDLHGKTFAFANEHSTAGRYLSQSLLVQSGITAGDLGQYAYLGRHDKVAHAVAAGKYDAGVLRSTVLDSVDVRDKLKSIARFDVPEKLWVARAGLPEMLIRELRDAFGSDFRPDELAGLRVSGFTFPPVDDYDRVRREIEFSAGFGSLP